jgi:hypothetical protein
VNRAYRSIIHLRSSDQNDKTSLKVEGGEMEDARCEGNVVVVAVAWVSVNLLAQNPGNSDYGAVLGYKSAQRSGDQRCTDICMGCCATQRYRIQQRATAVYNDERFAMSMRTSR